MSARTFSWNEKPNITPDFTSNAHGERYGSRDGVSELLRKYSEKNRLELIHEQYKQFHKTEDGKPFPIHALSLKEIQHIESAVAKRKELLVSPGGELAKYMGYSVYQIKQLSITLAEKQESSAIQKIDAARRLLGCDIPGKSLEAQYSRCCSASFWRRTLSTMLKRADEHLFLRLGLIGLYDEKYASDTSIDARENQLRAQRKWMQSTVLVPKEFPNGLSASPHSSELRLIDIVQTPEARYAKLYTFIKAMEILADESKLQSAMVTITLETEWHPNPSIGVKQWNGKSPREAHQSFCKRWQSINRDLHRDGIRLSGLRVVEPHGDGCPHYHILMLYRPEHEAKILCTLMKYFPDRMKVVSARKTHKGAVAHDRVLYKNRNELIAHKSIPCSKKDRSQVEFSKIASGTSSASYVTKYLLATLPSGMSQQAQVSEDNDDCGSSSKQSSVKRVDSYRSVWGMNRGQLFGIAKCLTIWDELRRMTIPPLNATLRKLWEKARGGNLIGRIEKGDERPGDAVGFLRALGGLDAARTQKKKNSKRLFLSRLVEEGLNKHGEVIKKTVGICVIKKEIRRAEGTPNHKSLGRAKWRTFISIIASVKTKLVKWEFRKNNFPVISSDLRPVFPIP